MKGEAHPSLAHIIYGTRAKRELYIHALKLQNEVILRENGMFAFVILCGTSHLVPHRR